MFPLKFRVGWVWWNTLIIIITLHSVELSWVRFSWELINNYLSGSLPTLLRLRKLSLFKMISWLSGSFLHQHATDIPKKSSAMSQFLSFYEVNKAIIQARMLSGTEALCRFSSANRQWVCLLSVWTTLH